MATLTKLRVWFRVGLGLAPSAAGEMEAHLKLLEGLFLLTSLYLQVRVRYVVLYTSACVCAPAAR